MYSRNKPDKIYLHHFDWTEDFVRNNIDIIERNYAKYPTRNRWNTNCHVIHDNDTDVEMIDYSFLRKEYEILAEKISQDAELQKWCLSDIWYNFYKTGQGQEEHDHDGNGGFSMVHYLIFNPEVHCSTKFIRPEVPVPDLVQGDVLIFPAHWVHSVPDNESNERRLTAACTLTRMNI